MRTSDPEAGARRLSRMPTLECERCGEYYWDIEAHRALSDIDGRGTTGGVEDAVRGSVCPECGHQQDP